MPGFEPINNAELLSALAGASAAEQLMLQYNRITDLSQASFDELQTLKGIGRSKSAAQTNDHAAAVLRRYHARPAEELYDLTSDPHEQNNLATDPRYASRLKKLRRQLDNWLRDQGDALRVYAEQPRLLSDPTSYGPGALPPGGRPKPRSD